MTGHLSSTRQKGGEPVILDSDLAALHGIATKTHNQANRRKFARFPAGFALRLIAEDWTPLRSQIVTLESGGREQPIQQQYGPTSKD
jgi:hypothetical protein